MMRMSERRRTGKPGRITPAGEVGDARHMPIGALEHGSRVGHGRGRHGSSQSGGASASPTTEPEQRPTPPPRDPELERRIDLARRAVYERGLQEGLTRGHAAGMAQAQEALRNEYLAGEQAAGGSAAARMQALTTAFASEYRGFEMALADQILELAVALSERLVGDHIAQVPDAVLVIVRQCLATIGRTGSQVVVRVSPVDHATVLAGIGNEPGMVAPTFVADPAIAPGGCLIETADTVVDARMPTRWRRALAALGMSDAEVPS